MSADQSALLQADGARIAIDDVVAIENLSFTSLSDRLLCVGDCEALFALLTGIPVSARSHGQDADDLPGEAHLVAGALSIAGRDVESRAFLTVTGVAPLDPPMPGDFTAQDYVAWSARLGGSSARDARDMAAASLIRLGLAALLRRKIGTLTVPERRAVVLAQAVVLAPAVVVAQSPLAGLDGQAASFLTAAISAATEDRKAIFSVSRIDPGTPEGHFARGARDVAILSHGELVFAGPAAELFSEARVYGLIVRSNVDPFRAELAARGIELRGGPTRFSAALPEGRTTREFLAAAKVARAAVIEMLPLVG